MKKTITAILMMLATSAAMLAQDTYQVMSLKDNTQVKISGKAVKAGDTFSSQDTIVWTGKKQAMEVKQTATGNVYRLSRRQFTSKGRDVKSVKGLFAYTSVEVARDENGNRKVNLSMKETNKAEYYSEKRIALVIGNSLYSADQDMLKGEDGTAKEGFAPMADAQQKAEMLVDSLNNLGYNVLESYDANTGELQTLMKQFPLLAKDYEAVLFCYIGHAVQKDGESYIVPVNALPGDADLTEKCLKASDMIKAVAGINCASKTIVIAADGVNATTVSAEAAETLAGMTTAYSLTDDFLGSRAENLYAKAKAEEEAAAAEAKAAIEALAALEAAAQPTTPDECFAEGMRLIDRSSPDRNIDTGIVYLKKAANSGHVEAMYQLALVYQGIDSTQAMIWMGRASSAGHAKAKAYVTARKTKPTGK